MSPLDWHGEPQESAELSPSASQEQGRLDLLIFAAIVVFSFAVFLTQNPSSVLPRTTMYFDAAHYLESCRRLYDACNSFAAGQLGRGQVDALAFYLLLDGPVLPGAGVILFLLAGKVPALAEWQSLVSMQCFFQALCSGFVYLLTNLLSRNRRLSAFAAIIWTAYPSAISSCNSFLTEPLACLLSVSFLYFTAILIDSGDKPSGVEEAASVDLRKPDQTALREALLSFSKGLAAGISFALLSLLKPALAPASLLAGMFCFFFALYPALCEFAFEKSKIGKFFRSAITLKSLSVLLGIMIVFLPWFGFAYMTRGALTILPSRRPVYNITTGCNIDGDGWGCYPTHPLAQMYDDSESAVPVALGLIGSNPGEIANLSLRKITRLWNLPWNDYRYKILGLSYRVQALYHQLLCLLGFAGMIFLLAACCERDYFGARAKCAVAAIWIFMVGHMIYLPFEGISRYGFTALPLIVVAAACMIQRILRLACRRLALSLFCLSMLGCLFCCKFDFLPFLSVVCKDANVSIILAAVLRSAFFAAFGAAIWNLYGCGKTNALSRRVLLSLVVLLGGLASLISFAFAFSGTETEEWKCLLKAGDLAERSVKVSMPPGKQADWALLLVDGDQGTGSAVFSLNGRKLNASAESVYQFWTEKYELEDWLNQFASLIRKTPDSIRRWRALELPVAQIKEGWNTLSASPGVAAPVTIFGDYRLPRRCGQVMLPSPSEVSPGKFFNDTEEGFDSRIAQTCLSRPAESRSVFYRHGKKQDNDLSNSAGVQTGNYRMFLLLGYRHTIRETANQAENQAERRFKRVLSSGPSPDAPVHLAADAPAPTRMELAVPPQCLNSSHLRVRIEGRARSQSAAAFSVAVVTKNSSRFGATVLPGTPVMLNTAATWNKFAVEGDLPAVTLSEKNAALQIEMRAVGAQTDINNLTVALEPVDKPQFSQHSVRVF